MMITDSTLYRCIALGMPIMTLLVPAAMYFETYTVPLTLTFLLIGCTLVALIFRTEAPTERSQRKDISTLVLRYVGVVAFGIPLVLAKIIYDIIAPIVTSLQ